MLRKTFEQEIQQLKDDILILGSMVEQSLLEAVEALKKRDLVSAQKTVDRDKEINQKRYAIENQVMISIATQQPMARDLRLLASILEVASEIERMGDYAKGIAIINQRMGNEALLKPLVDVPRMAQICADTLHRALTAFVNEDVDAAREIPKEDDRVDELYTQVYRELITYIIQEPKNIERANWLLWVAHNLERFSDRVANICERTIFVATGELRELSSSTDELELHDG
jgi:phosphate transport system protein